MVKCYQPNYHNREQLHYQLLGTNRKGFGLRQKIMNTLKIYKEFKESQDGGLKCSYV